MKPDNLSLFQDKGPVHTVPKSFKKRVNIGLDQNSPMAMWMNIYHSLRLHIKSGQKQKKMLIFVIVLWAHRLYLLDSAIFG